MRDIQYSTECSPSPIMAAVAEWADEVLLGRRTSDGMTDDDFLIDSEPRPEDDGLEGRRTLDGKTWDSNPIDQESRT